MEIVKVATDFYQKTPEERVTRLAAAEDLPETLQKNKEEKKLYI